MSDPITTNGFISFVSSGPGDPELLTQRAVKRLQVADVVLYDALAAGPILDLAGPQAQLINVGKRAGRPSAKQESVNALLVEHGRAGRHVLRLKSGDCGIFGRLEEEITALNEAGLAFEIVPGVPSALAAAALAGMPLTRRLTARRLQFITAADITGALPETLNWAAIADPKATTAVFMGQRNFPALVQQLVARGMSPDTPALLAEAVGHPQQRLLRSTITELADLLTREGPSPHPALIFYGPLAATHDMSAMLPSAVAGLS